MYKKILIPVAFDHGQHGYEAVKLAQLLADDGAEVTLLNVLEDLPPYVSVEIQLRFSRMLTRRSR